MGRLEADDKKKKPDNPLATIVGDNLLRCRRKTRETIRVLSERTGLSQAHLCDMENAKRNPSLATAVILSKHFGVSLDYWTVDRRKRKG